MNYSQIIKNNRTELIEREDIEWSNFWWDQANTYSDYRILLMGDSTARMVRSTLAKMTGKPVDLFATTSALHDSLFVNQMDCFFKCTEYQYNVVFVQFGDHAEIGFGGGFYKESDWAVFQEEFKTLLLYLSERIDKIIVESIFYTVIPTKSCVWGGVLDRARRKLFRSKEVLNDEINERKRIKTRIMFEIAEDMGFQTLDINKYMLTEGAHFYHNDHIHYEDAAREFICAKMMESL